MNTAWFITLGVMLMVYALLDGLDLGVGVVHFFLARNDQERRALLAVIGPFWFGYEVWLIASGGAMLAAFPILYADSFSGFYLVLTVVLWMLIARGTSIEFRGRVSDPLWRSFWDVVLTAASLILTIFFGAAFANVFRGVPIDSNGEFVGTFTQALNPFAIEIGLLSAALLSIHGLGYAASRLVDSPLRTRALKAAKVILVGAAPLTLAAVLSGAYQRPDVYVNFAHDPLLLAVPFAGAVGFATLIRCTLIASPRGILTGTSLLIAGLMGSAGISLYPKLLPIVGSATGGLTIYNCAVPRASLISALAAAIVSLVAVAIYTRYEHTVFNAKIEVTSDELAH